MINELKEYESRAQAFYFSKLLKIITMLIDNNFLKAKVEIGNYPEGKMDFQPSLEHALKMKEILLEVYTNINKLEDAKDKEYFKYNLKIISLKNNNDIIPFE
ncbi:MAG: hypothetical protein R3Y46_03615 [Opitutales bacterium]